MNKQGALTDMFLFMIVAILILLVSGMFIYMGVRVNAELHTNLDNQEIGDAVNYSEIIDNSMGQVDVSYRLMYWLSILLIVGMMISVFIGNYMVTTRPIFFVPYLFITIIAILVSVGISNAYQEIIADPTLASTFVGFIGSNFIMIYLPIWVTIISFIGGIIMFVRMKSQEYVPYG
jgi:hypothetical protein